MSRLSCKSPELIVDSCLQSWHVIGSGGFGQIYKARHCKWGCDVAVKLLHYDDGSSSSLLHEVDMMCQGSSPFILQVLGVFQGRLPPSVLPSPSLSSQLGLVMEFMERGSLASLQEALCGAPPWPLAFRLAHQVALGMNFLHSRSPAILHLDLKPSNVLLDSSLNAKLTDFGLARYSHSVTRASKRKNDDEGGTISYMPPEAFNISYSPTRASDIYSYGILLWSIVTGKQPYANAISSVVRLRISEGDRPPLHVIDRGQAAGLSNLMQLMESCWDPTASQRPSALECITVTEGLFDIHKHAINGAVHRVVLQLDQKEEERRLLDKVAKVHITRPLGSSSVEPVEVCHNVLTGPPPVQETAGGLTASQRDSASASAKGQASPRPARGAHAESDHPTSLKAKGSSVLPNPASPPSPLLWRSQKDRAQNIAQSRIGPNLPGPYQRQFSSPETLACSPSSAPGISIHMSHVTGLQNGNNNYMCIHTDISERRRHPTAPSTVTLLPQQSGRHQAKTGGAG
ncbi:receptor-interacting serine/threonine-protein kinase 3 [Myripristis murdjan]|uniref:receptor-interacting serine/threonine-protein kinase 3 n=1 Tax=Myripristis murdjan TaxID=586833 RepID=UPI001175E2EF|nr:receptor-interacting serine/threonine-protein kinase 3-like [Myripristis murdjan]